MNMSEYVAKLKDQLDLITSNSQGKIVAEYYELNYYICSFMF